MKPHLAFEGFREMTLIGKARGQGNLGQWRRAVRKLPASEVDAQLADIFARRVAEVLAENAAK